jgi:NUMOD3 motif
MNKYTKWYSAITTNAKQRQLDTYTERHHILPESLGGPNTADNLVDLTAREHFVCHWLLTKIYPTGEEHWKMLNALRMMRAENPRQQRYKTKITGRVYANLKEEYAKIQSEKNKGAGNGFYGKQHTDEARRRISEANTGRKQTPEEKAKQIKAITGRKRAPFDEVWLDKLSQAKQGENNPRYGVEVTEETRKKIGDKIRGRKHTEEEKKRRADAIRGLKREKRLCPHCLQSIAVNTYARWHGDRCRTLAQTP